MSEEEKDDIKSSGESTSFGIKKFNGTNYKSWAFNAKLVLRRKGLWGIVSKEETLSATADADTKGKFNKRKERALDILFLTIDENEQANVSELTDPIQLWETLKEIYTPQSKIERLNAYRAFATVQLLQGENMHAYINRVKQLAKDMEDAGLTRPPDDIYCIALLAGLSEEYASFVTMTEALPATEYVPKSLEKMLVGEYKRQQGLQTYGAIPAVSQVQAKQTARKPATKTRKKPTASEEKPKSKATCWNCGQDGHFARGCAKPKKKEVQLVQHRKEKSNSVLLATINTTGQSEDHDLWKLDCAASFHVTPRKEDFKTYEVYKGPPVVLADGTKYPIAGVGTVNLKILGLEVTVTQVYHIPGLKARLISLGSFTRKGGRVVFHKNLCILTLKNGNVIKCFRAANNLYTLPSTMVIRQSRSSQLVAQATSQLENSSCTSLSKRTRKVSGKDSVDSTRTVLWHRRLGHLPYPAMKVLQTKNLVRGLEDEVLNEPSACEVCAQTKMTRLPFTRKPGDRAKECLSLTHSDICGPIKVVSHDGFRYILTFIDDYSRRAEVVLLRRKSDALKSFKDYQVLYERQKGTKLQVLRSDNGGEYTSKAFQEYLKSSGIKHQLTNFYSPQENGVAERYNRTLITVVRAMLCDAKLPLSLWSEAVRCACFLRNTSPTKALKNAVPLELWSGRKPTVKFLKVFGCKAFVHVPKAVSSGKLSPTAEPAIFVGYAPSRRGFRCWVPKRNKVVESRSVKFLEEELGCNASQPTKVLDKIVYFSEGATTKVGEEPDSDKRQTQTVAVQEVDELDNSGGNEVVQEAEDEMTDDDVEDQLEDRLAQSPVPQQTPEASPRAQPEQRYGLRPRAQLKCPERYRDDDPEVPEVNEVHGDVQEPNTYKEAVSGPQREEWRAAAQEEYESLCQMGVWELTTLPPGRKAIGHKWVFRVKRDSEGKIVRFKARLVAKGFSQKYGIDFWETYSPVVTFSVIRLLLSIAAVRGWLVEQMDIKTAYLNGELTEELYLTQPEGFVEKGSEHLVCRLRRSLYGLKQSGRCWNETMNKRFVQAGLVRSKADPCVYYTPAPRERGLVCVFVDDNTVIAERPEGMALVKRCITESFKAHDLGQIHYLLGVKISKTNSGAFTLNQTKYVDQVLERFGMRNSFPVGTPLSTIQPLVKIDGTENKDLDSDCNCPYREALGSLMYLAQCTRPDIAHAVSRLAQFSESPKVAHWIAVKRVFRYLKGTRDWSLKLGSTDDPIHAFSDADWAGSTSVGRKSFTGYCIMSGGSPVHWKSVKQKCIASSTMEAEYVALASCVKEVRWIRNLLTELRLGEFVPEPICIYSDNKAAICSAEDPVPHTKSRHIDLRHHQVREAVSQKLTEVRFVPSSENVADIFTKSLPKPRHQELSRLLGLGCHQ